MHLRPQEIFLDANLFLILETAAFVSYTPKAVKNFVLSATSFFVPSITLMIGGKHLEQKKIRFPKISG
jgi:hypothetical protein